MKRGRRLPYSLLLLAILAGAAILTRDGGASLPATPLRSKAQWAHAISKLPLTFEANRGQTDSSVRFLSRGRGYSLFLTGNESVLTVRNSSSESAGVLRLRLLGSNARSTAQGEDQLPGKANYFIGNDHSKWRTDIPTYAKVRYNSIYPGIDLVYYGNQGGELESDFIVSPGADPRAIAFGVGSQGHTSAKLDPQGNLVVTLPSGNVRLHKPVVYQKTDQGQGHGDKRQTVDGRFALDAQNNVHFELGPYDHSRPLIIDPVLEYATFIGGSGGDIGYAVAVDTNYDAYITGVTNSTNFPTDTPYQSANKGNGDCFITKINSAATALIYSTYLGGTQSDQCTALALYAGSVMVTGYTTSVDFPTAVPTGSGTINPFQLNYAGNTDAFVAELSTTGNTLVYSTYLGGSGADFAQGIAADNAGNAYVTGTTQSKNFPTLNPYQGTNNGSENVFVTKVNPSGEALVYSTFIGGSQADVGQAIVLDSSDNAYVAGYTFSSDFPVVAPLQSTLGGGADAFVLELNANGTGLTFSTFLGGTADDRAYAIALDSNEDIYLAGATSSTNFPTNNPIYPALKGAGNAFVAKLNTSAKSIVYSTYLGGSGIDQANGIAVDSSGDAFVTGFTESGDFPTQNPIQSVLGLSNNQLCGSTACPDVFVAEVNPSGSALTYSTYLGGNGYDSGQGLALDTNGTVYITGTTSSSNFPVASPPVAGTITTGTGTTQYVAPYQSVLGGTAGNAFVASLATVTSTNAPNISISPTKLNFGNETIAVASVQQQVQIFNPSTVPLVITSIDVTPIPVTGSGTSTNVFTESDNCVGTLNPGEYCLMYVTFTPNSAGNETDTISIQDNASGTTGTEQTVFVTGTGVTANTAVTIVPSSLSFTSTAVGSVSAPQSVTVTNTGTQTLDISKISVSDTDFSETDNCGTVYNDTLAVGQSCQINVVFQPTASNTRSATLQISDNATGSPQGVSLTGTGAAAFSLTYLNSTCGSSTLTNPTLIGSTQTTFCIVVNGPTSFNGAISLQCSTGTTCNFSTNPVFVGNTTTLTVSNLTTNMANPYIFTVTGTSGSESTTENVNLEFEDYTITASPTSAIVQAGTPGAYHLYINPLYGFNYQVNMLCLKQTLPPDAICSFTPSATPTINGGSPTELTLSISTVKYVAPQTHVPPGFFNGKLPPVILGLLSLAALISLAFGNKRRARHGWLGAHWATVRIAALSLIMVLNLSFVACRPSTLVISGTTTGSYVITIEGILNPNQTVYRTTTLDLSVTSSPQCTVNCS